MVPQRAVQWGPFSASLGLCACHQSGPLGFTEDSPAQKMAFPVWGPARNLPAPIRFSLKIMEVEHRNSHSWCHLPPWCFTGSGPRPRRGSAPSQGPSLHAVCRCGGIRGARLCRGRGAEGSNSLIDLIDTYWEICGCFGWLQSKIPCVLGEPLSCFFFPLSSILFPWLFWRSCGNPQQARGFRVAGNSRSHPLFKGSWINQQSSLQILY